MSEKNIDQKVKTAFDYALGRESFVRDSVNYIWSNWGNVSEETRQYILGVLGEAIKTYELENLENTLILTFTNDYVIYRGCIGNSTTAGLWRGLYNLVSEPSANRSPTKLHPRQSPGVPISP
jgi:hypothetical protein